MKELRPLGDLPQCFEFLYCFITVGWMEWKHIHKPINNLHLLSPKALLRNIVKENQELGNSGSQEISH